MHMALQKVTGKTVGLIGFRMRTSWKNMPLIIERVKKIIGYAK